MIKTKIKNHSFEIRPITQDNLEAILNVYKLCEDFLALGPVDTASMNMVIKDIENSKNDNGVFCGIHAADGKMIGVLDYIPKYYKGNPHIAYLSLLMIAFPFRNKGIGKGIVNAFEIEIKKDKQIKTILSGVQVNNPQAIRFWKKNGYCIVSEPKLLPDQTTVYDLKKDIETA